MLDNTTLNSICVEFGAELYWVGVEGITTALDDSIHFFLLLLIISHHQCSIFCVAYYNHYYLGAKRVWFWFVVLRLYLAFGLWMCPVKWIDRSFTVFFIIYSKKKSFTTVVTYGTILFYSIICMPLEFYDLSPFILKY